MNQIFNKIIGDAEITIQSVEYTYWEECFSKFKFIFHHKRYDLENFDDRLNFEDYSSWEEYKEAIEEEYNPIFINPVYMTDHSYLSLSIGKPADKWDSGQIGFAILLKEDYDQLCEYSDSKTLSKKTLEEILIDDLIKYEAYLNGDIYEMIIEYPEDSMCYGYYYGCDWKTNGLYDDLPEAYKNIINEL